MKRKILAQFLALGLALTSFPISAFAAEIQENVETKAESTDDTKEESVNQIVDESEKVKEDSDNKVTEIADEGKATSENEKSETISDLKSDSENKEDSAEDNAVETEDAKTKSEVIVPAAQKNNPESENIWPVIIKQLQIIQA